MAVVVVLLVLVVLYQHHEPIASKLLSNYSAMAPGKGVFLNPYLHLMKKFNSTNHPLLLGFGIAEVVFLLQVTSR